MHDTPDPRDRAGASNAAPEAKIAAPLGAAGGALAGGTAGTLILGPIGTIIGAIVGAVGGGWAGLAGSRAVEYTGEHERAHREHFESQPGRPADLGWESARPAYQLGWYAAHNPDYQRRTFDSIEADLRRGWSDDVRSRHGDWERARGYARAAYERQARGEQGTALHHREAGGTDTHRRASFSDPLPDLIDPVNSSTGQSVSGDVPARETAEPGWMERAVDPNGGDRPDRDR